MVLLQAAYGGDFVCELLFFFVNRTLHSPRQRLQIRVYLWGVCPESTVYLYIYAFGGWVFGRLWAFGQV